MDIAFSLVLLCSVLLFHYSTLHLLEQKRRPQKAQLLAARLMLKGRATLLNTAMRRSYATCDPAFHVCVYNRGYGGAGVP